MHSMIPDIKIGPQLQAQIVAKLQNYPEILFAILYGSVVGEGTDFNDLDIGLFVDRAAVPVSADLDYTFSIADELEQIAPHPVDVRVINDAPLGFQYNVSQGKALMIRDEAAYFNFLERTWDEFLDFKPVAMQYLRELQ